MNRTVSTDSLPNLGPGAFAPDANSPFFMSVADFTNLQRYLDAGTQLPLTPNDLVVRLKMAATDAASAEFSGMLDGYNKLATHCGDFRSNTLTPMITLAEDIANYGDDASGTYLPALVAIIEVWQNATDATVIAKLKAKFAAALDVLRQAADDNAAKAKAMQTKIKTFTDETTADQAFLQPIRDTIEKKYQGEGGEIARLMTEVKNDSDQMDYWNSEYNKDVTIACTTACYAWVVPYGTVAAAIVAGVYGKKAQDALDKVHQFRDQMNAASAEEQRDVQLMADLKIADTSLSGILTALQGALLVLQKMEGIWTALSGDIAAISTNLSKANTVPLIIKDAVADAVIAAWVKVSKEARTYVTNAFVTIVTEAEVSANPADPRFAAPPPAPPAAALVLAQPTLQPA